MGLLAQTVNGRQVGVLGTGMAGLCLLACLTTGCVGTRPLISSEEQAKVPCQIDTIWEKKVVYTPDVVHNGVSTPGLAGRLYLFGPEFGSPLAGDGSAIVDLYDDSPLATGAPPKMLEKWILDKESLKKLQRKDMVGQGYTLFLPWGTYKPDIAQVHLVVTYKTQKGTALYTTSPPIILNGGSGANVQVANRTVVPAKGGVMPTGGMAPISASPLPMTNTVVPAGYPGIPAPGVNEVSYGPAPPGSGGMTRWPERGSGMPPLVQGSSGVDVQRYVIQR